MYMIYNILMKHSAGKEELLCSHLTAMFSFEMFILDLFVMNLSLKTKAESE